MSIEKLSESEPTDDPSLVLQSTVKTADEYALRDQSGRDLLTAPVAVGVKAARAQSYRVTTDSNHRLPMAPNMLQRRFDDRSANQAWVSDITFIATAEGWLYLASRWIVGWSMSERINAELVCQTLRSACWQRKPPSGLIPHSDQGSMPAGLTGHWPHPSA